MNYVSIINVDEIYRMFHYGYVKGFEKKCYLGRWLEVAMIVSVCLLKALN